MLYFASAFSLRFLCVPCLLLSRLRGRQCRFQDFLSSFSVNPGFQGWSKNVIGASLLQNLLFLSLLLLCKVCKTRDTPFSCIVRASQCFLSLNSFSFIFLNKQSRSSYSSWLRTPGRQQRQNTLAQGTGVATDQLSGLLSEFSQHLSPSCRFKR